MLTENKRHRFADIKARLGMRAYTAAGPSGPIVEDQVVWLPCVTLADVERLIAEVERMGACAGEGGAVSETPYIETEALLRLLRDDESAAWAIVRGMLPRELLSLCQACSTLERLTQLQLRVLADREELGKVGEEGEQ